MKNILTFFVFLFFEFNINAQGYQSLFGSTSTSWNELAGFMGYGTDSLVANIDTVIKGKTYKLILYYHYSIPVSILDTTIIGFLREDTLSGKAWYFTTNDTTDWLIMDLELSVGDSFWMNGSTEWQSDYYLVDSVYFDSGLKHVRLDLHLKYLDETSGKVTFIEGIGSNAGISYQDASYYFNRPFLMCAHKNGIISYRNTYPNYGGLCILRPNRIDNLTENNKINIYPNPVINMLNIQINFPYDISSYIAIIDVFGRIVKQKKLFKEHTYCDLSKQPSGMYALIIYGSTNNKKEILYYKKVIKI